MGRSLLRELRVPVLGTPGHWSESDLQLLPSPGEKFWTEHSERHFLVSVAACLSLQKDHKDFLGRWGLNREQSNAYVLTGKLIVHDAQKLVCERLSMGCRYCEQDLLDSYEEFMFSEIGIDEAKEARGRLKILSSMGNGYGLAQNWPNDPHAYGFLGEEAMPKSEYAGSLMLPQAPEGPEGPLLELPEEVPLLEVGPGAPAPYWASISVKKGFRRLHRTGGCWVKPGVDCAQWAEIFSLDESAADASCKLCWPPVVPASDSEGSDESSSSDDS
jgi:hypothetical protein